MRIYPSLELPTSRMASSSKETIQQDILINYYQQCVDLIIKKVGSWQTIHGYKIVVDISFEFASAINALE